MVQNLLLTTISPTNKPMYLNTLAPLGILSIAAYIRSKGFGVHFIDGYVEDIDEEIFFKYDYIGMSINISNINNSIEIATKIKKHNPHIKIIAGGVYPTQHPEYMLSNNFDAVVVGEGEITFYEYMAHDDPSVIPGLYILKDNKSFFTGMREKIKDLDSLPFPALDLVDLNDYNIPLKKKRPISTIMTSRDCPHECIFCYHEKGWRSRSPQNVVSEIEWQIKNFNIKEICIIDDFFNLDMKRVEEICDIILEKNIKIILQCWGGLRVDKVNKEMLIKLKKAGVWLIGMAPESGNPETLIKVKKKFTLEQISNVRKWCKDLGLVTYAFFMVGFPWEDKKQIEATLRFAKNLDTEIVQFSRVYPMQGTELYEMVKDQYQEQKADQGFFYGGSHLNINGLSSKEVEKLIKKGYRSIYLSPKKMYGLLVNLSVRDIYSLAKYAIVTNSM